jgi:hypothetical protein
VLVPVVVLIWFFSSIPRGWEPTRPQSVARAAVRVAVSIALMPLVVAICSSRPPRAARSSSLIARAPDRLESYRQADRGLVAMIARRFGRAGVAERTRPPPRPQARIGSAARRQWPDEPGPARSSREGGLWFSGDPRAGRLTLRATCYAEP